MMIKTQQTIRRWTTKALLAAAFALPAIALAQQPQDDPREGDIAFAGGQLVRGTVSVIAADRLTVKTESGDTYQVAVSPNTRLTRDRQPIKLTDIKPGDGIGAMGILDPATKTVHAIFIGTIDAAAVKKAREDMGKVYITGKLTAIDMDNLKLTVLRPDGVTQVIAVDEQTSFRRGGRGIGAMANGSAVIDAPASPDNPARSSGESITLADLKVGDAIAGRGALKNNVFTPTELHVMDPAAAGQRRRRNPGGTPPAAANQPQ